MRSLTQFRHDLRAGRFTMEFAQSGEMALERIADAAEISIILILIQHQLILIQHQHGRQLVAAGKPAGRGLNFIVDRQLGIIG